MLFVVRLFLCVCVAFLVVLGHPDENLSTSALIKKHGYPVEEHTIQTSDGYLLKAQRIPHGISNKVSREVALFLHGMGGSAENFLILGPSEALAFYLADRGYDVWLLNARGTAHSRRHRSLNPDRDRRKFWNFSWHEIATRDLPATINYILNKTGKEKLYYVGHSQGTTSLFVMLSEMPEMNDKIKVAGLLAPSAHQSLTHSPLILMSTRFLELGQRLLGFLGWHEMAIPNSPIINRILMAFCRSPLLSEVCMDVVYMTGGAESGLINTTLLPLILQYSPSGFATRQVWHYAQVIKSGEFKQYDYGKRKNLRLYNSTKPPHYDISRTKVPVAMIYAQQDPFANSKMIEALLKDLTNVTMLYEVPVEGFGHLDYILGQNAKEMVYDPLYKTFEKYEDYNNI